MICICEKIRLANTLFDTTGDITLTNIIYYQLLVYISIFRVIPVRLFRILVNDILRQLNIPINLKKNIEKECLKRLRQNEYLTTKKIDREHFDFSIVNKLKGINNEISKIISSSS